MCKQTRELVKHDKRRLNSLKCEQVFFFVRKFSTMEQIFPMISLFYRFSIDWISPVIWLPLRSIDLCPCWRFVCVFGLARELNLTNKKILPSNLWKFQCVEQIFSLFFERFKLISACYGRSTRWGIHQNVAMRCKEWRRVYRKANYFLMRVIFLISLFVLKYITQY